MGEKCVHDFRPLAGPYFKEGTGNARTPLPTYDQAVAYQMLYCSKCGDTREIIARDTRRRP